MSHIIRRLLLYVGLAVAFLIVFAALFALSIRTGIAVPMRWVGLAIWTAVIFVVVVRSERSYWGRPSYWSAVMGLLILHVLAFTIVLRSYPHWRPLWFIPIAAVEAGLFTVVLEMLFARKTR